MNGPPCWTPHHLCCEHSCLKIKHDITVPAVLSLCPLHPLVCPSPSAECGRPLKASQMSTHQTWPEEGGDQGASLSVASANTVLWEMELHPTGAEAPSPLHPSPTVSAHPQPHVLFVCLCNQLQPHSAPNAERRADDSPRQRHIASVAHANPAGRGAPSRCCWGCTVDRNCRGKGTSLKKGL